MVGPSNWVRRFIPSEKAKPNTRTGPPIRHNTVRLQQYFDLELVVSGPRIFASRPGRAEISPGPVRRAGLVLSELFEMVVKQISRYKIPILLIVTKNCLLKFLYRFEELFQD